VELVALGPLTSRFDATDATFDRDGTPRDDAADAGLGRAATGGGGGGAARCAPDEGLFDAV
jgi:hypothetical protein